MSRSMTWIVLALSAILFGGCYQTYDPYTGHNRYWPDFNLDYINDMSPAVDPESPAVPAEANAPVKAP